MHSLFIAASEEPVMNGDVTENGHGDSAPEPKKCDIIVITGKKENCEQAKAALLVSCLLK